MKQAIQKLSILPSTTSPEISWEKQLEAIPGIRRLSECDFDYLKNMLSKCDNPDSFLTSPNYFLFTGRQGLWIYERQDSFLLVCWHPNTTGRALIFPQINNDKNELLAKLLSVIPVAPKGIQIARVPQSTNKKTYAAVENRNLLLLERAEETLDWQFPVHILSTQKVANTLGHEFMHIRNRLRQTHKYSVKTAPFDAIHHSRSIENLLHNWAQRNAENRSEYEQLYAPYETLFSSSMNSTFGLSGLMIYVENKLEAVALWDISNSQNKTANLFVNFCNVTIKGLSELLIVKSCEALSNQGIKFLNLGGSESAGLNRYKSKFAPATSLQLNSIELDFHSVEPVDNSIDVRAIA
ncbi:MAG: phosphatidylglycerol lysyltransferase domain-containing protein [Alphaproteobacteria bacterium]